MNEVTKHSYKLSQVAHYFSVSRQTCHRWLKDGYLSYAGTSRDKTQTIFVTEDSVKSLAKKRISELKKELKKLQRFVADN